MGTIGIMGGNASYSSGLTNLPVTPAPKLHSRQNSHPRGPSLEASSSARGGRTAAFLLHRLLQKVLHGAHRRKFASVNKIKLGRSGVGLGTSSLSHRHFSPKLGTPIAADFPLETAASVRSSSPFDPMMRTSVSPTSTRWAKARR